MQAIWGRGGDVGFAGGRHGVPGRTGGVERGRSGLVAAGVDPEKRGGWWFARAGAPDLRKRTRPGSGDEGGEPARGFVLPHQRSVSAATAVAPAPGRYSDADGTFSAEIWQGFSACRAGAERRDTPFVSGVFVAGERERAGERCP